MSEQSSSGESKLTFAEINTDGPGRKYTYRPLRKLANAVIVMGSINCASLFVRMLALSNQWTLLQRIGGKLFHSQQEMKSAALQSDQFVRFVSVIFLITLILTYVTGALWIYRAACNVRAMGARRLENTPGWAVGWYFVPFMGLFKPFGAMVEIWNGSLFPERWRTLSTPDLLRWWWGLWLGTSFLGWLQTSMSKAAKTLPSLILLTQAQIVESAVDVAGIIVFLVVVLKITRMQANTFANASETASIFS